MNLPDCDIDLIAVTAYLERSGPVILLESQSPAHPAANKTFLAAFPESELIVRDDSLVERRPDGSRKQRQGDPWEALKQFHSRTDGWLFGYLGYDLKNRIEHLSSNNRDPLGAPDLYIMNPGLIIECSREGLSVIKGTLSGVRSFTKGRSGNGYSIRDFMPRISELQYCDKIREAQQRIFEGDFYEINLSHQMAGVFEGEALAIYRAMKRAGPVPFGAYLSFDRWKVCSASPERFLAKEGARVFSQPIKGTVHRGKDPSEDIRLRNWLRNSEKNRAENLMIVDLVRNDLGRIARKGTVKTSDMFEIQSFGTVHQMVSTVAAEAGDHHPVDIIKACFPMGSMTGAPKISAMRAIEDLEDYRRGIYSGAIGYLTPEGDFDFNVVIRTAVIKGSQLYYSVGGAITSDSDPRSEWEETLVKARALADAVTDNRFGRKM